MKGTFYNKKNQFGVMPSGTILNNFIYVDGCSRYVDL